MSIVKKVLTGAALVALSTASFAAGKVVTFDPQMAVLSTKQAQQADAELNKKAEYSSMLAQFQSLQADLKSLEEEETNNGMTWSKDQRAEHRGKMEFKLADLKLLGQKLKSMQNNARARLVQNLMPKVEQVLEDIVKDEDIDMVLNSQAVIWAKPSTDITADVTKKLNKLN